MRSDRALIERWQRNGDSDARNELVQRYRGLVRAIALRFASRGEPVDDLVQVAWIGMLKAVDLFDLCREVEFSTYATPTITGEIKRHFRDRTWMLRVPRPVQELRTKVHQAIDDLTAGNGAAPTVAQLAEHLDVDEEAVLEALQSDAAKTASPLDIRDDDGESPRGHDPGTFDHGYEECEARMLVGSALDGLPERERLILKLRFEDGLTQSQIATRIGISQMHVSRLLRRSLETLRECVGDVADVLSEV